MTDGFDTVKTGEISKANPDGGKYKLNKDFNQKEKKSLDSQLVDDDYRNDLMPSILKGHNWDSSEIAQEPVDMKWDLESNDPFSADTVAQRSDLDAREDANWRKFNTNKKFKMQLLHDGNLKQIPFKEEVPMPDTFAKKHPGKVYRSTLELKNVEKIIDESDKIMDKIKKDSLDSKQQPQFADSSYSQDYTSDAEEFESIASTKNYLLEGNKLFDNLKQGLNQVPNDYPSTRSDYTSEEEIFQEDDVKQDPDLDQLEKLLGIVQFNENINVQPVREPKLINFKSNDTLQSRDGIDEPIQVGPGILATPAPGHKGLKFIDGSVFKNKKWDVNQNKFIAEEEFNELYGDDFGIGDNTTVNNLKDMTELTGNSILKRDDSPNKSNGVSFNLPNTFTEEDEVDEETSFSFGGEVQNLSFSQTNEALVDAISEAYPEDDWLNVQELNISGYQLDKLRGLKTFVPNVWLLDSSNNLIDQHHGIPNGVQVLLLNDNKFGMNSTKFKGFSYLQVLDLSGNQLTSLSVIKSLKNLTSLNLKANRIEDISDLTNFHMLRYLNLSGNKLKGKLDFNDYQLWFLEDLLLDDNEINGIVNIIQLPHLIYISAKRNKINKFKFGDREHTNLKHTNLRKVVLSNNKLAGKLDMGFYPKLKELRIDRNYLTGVDNMSSIMDRISGMFSSKNTTRNIIAHSMDNKTMTNVNLVGCEFPKFTIMDGKFSGLTHLDLTSANLSSLPWNFSLLFPLLLDLNLNFNRLESLEGLKGLNHLQQLKMLSNNIKDIKEVFNGTESMRESLKLLDLRVNPITSKFYPYVFYEDKGGNDFTIDEYNENSDIGTEGFPQEEDEIEAFTVEYSKLYEKKGFERWETKTQIFEEGMSGNQIKAKRKYQGLVFCWFSHLKCLDGGKPSNRVRKEFVSGVLSE